MASDLEFVSASVSDRGLSEKRPQNEDSFAELPEHGVFAVADGVGGAQAGDVASQMAMEILSEAVVNRGAADPEDLFRLAIEQANKAIHQMASELPQLSTMATTVAALQIKGNIATIAHVGDSRVYRFTPDGQVHRETDDHSVVEEEVRAGRMTAEEALHHPARNVISRAVGAEADVNIDLKTIMVEPNTSFLLCSDGITRHIPDQELAEVFANGADPAAICAQLKSLCYERGAEDNLTAVVIRTYGESERQEADFHTTVPVIEEETVATARAGFDDTIAVDDGIPVEHSEIAASPDVELRVDEDEIDTGDLTVPATISIIPKSGDNGSSNEAEVIEPIQLGGSTAEYTSSRMAVPASEPTEPDFAIFGAKPTTKYVEVETRRGVFGRIIFPLFMLVLGGLIGVGAAFFSGWNLAQPLTEPPQVETMKTENIPLTSFEEARRNVDRDPVGYASKNAATPQDAGDHYLLGRALLLSNKPLEARRQFELAREQLADVDEAERKTLSAEIALAMAAVDSPQAVENLTRSVAAQSNENTNSAGTRPGAR